jgi:hypothetical protein
MQETSVGSIENGDRWAAIMQASSSSANQLAPIGVLQVMQAQFSADDMRDNVFFVLNFA